MKTRIYEDLAHFFPLWRETTLEKKGSEKKETQFVIDVFQQSPVKIQTVIDLGGGVGTHSDILANKGYKVTLLDQSKKALSIAKKSNPKITTVQGSFENINLKQNFDAAICMWSTLSYVLTEKGRKHFYTWQREHIKHLIILDEANFYRYKTSFHKIYEGQDQKYTMKVIRDWSLNNNLKKTKFVYEITDKKTGKTSIIKDAENEQYLSIPQIEYYLGTGWRLDGLFGDYSLQSKFNKRLSNRILPIFTRNN